MHTSHPAIEKKARKTSSDYALFVTAKTPNVQIRRLIKSNEVSQADVMKECGMLWRSEKERNKPISLDGLEVIADKLDLLFTVFSSIAYLYWSD